MEKVLHAVCVPANRHDAGDGLKPRSRFMLCTLGGLTLLGPDGPALATLITRRRKLVAATHHAEEAATAHGVSAATLGREWAVGRAWLRGELSR